MTDQHVISAIATAVVAGPIREDEIVERVSRLLGRRWRWIRPLARRLTEQFRNGCRPRRSQIADWIAGDAGFDRACQRHDITVDGEWICPPKMWQAAGISDDWSLPEITTVERLATWFDLPIEELEWLADQRGRECKTEATYRRYRYRLLAKGSRRFRLIEVPIFRLKELQRRMLSGILDRIPAHDAAHGFRAGRSIRSFVEPHTAREVVLKMDLEDFFPSVSFGRVAGLFRTVGYPEAVADLFASIATNVVPDETWESDARVSFRNHQALRGRYARPHLPQGAPSSPAIANLCAYRLDRRLVGLAASCGAVYTRYADDLVFSGAGEFARCVRRARHQIAAIALDEGFRVNYRKTRIMRQSVRQRVAGIVVNQHSNIARGEFDRLKAILHNCQRHGLESQNRDQHPDFKAHLAGKIAFVESLNPQRGKRLREMLLEIG
jgi:hypothetical protein